MCTFLEKDFDSGRLYICGEEPYPESCLICDRVFCEKHDSKDFSYDSLCDHCYRRKGSHVYYDFYSEGIRKRIEKWEAENPHESDDDISFIVSEICLLLNEVHSYEKEDEVHMLNISLPDAFVSHLKASELPMKVFIGESIDSPSSKALFIC